MHSFTRRPRLAVALMAVIGSCVAAGPTPARPGAPTARSIRAAGAARIPNTIGIAAPAQVRVRAAYDVTISGFARRPARAWLFIDYRRCAGSFRAERRRAGGESDVYVVRRSFAETTGWKSARTGTDHACAYLVGPGATVLATASRAYGVG